MRSRVFFAPLLAAASTMVCLSTANPAGAAADLRVSKSADADPAVAGGVLTYTVTATNDGPDGATNVVVVDTLPAQVTWISDDCPGGPPAGQVVSCPLGSIAASGSTSAHITVLVSPTATGSIVNTASVSGSESDSDQSDNSTSLTTGVATSTEILSGTANHVGLTPTDGEGDANIRVRGRFTLAGPIDLLGSSLTVDELLAENGTGGAGELVQKLSGGALLPLTLTARRVSPIYAIYQTPDSVRPTVRVELKNRPRGTSTFEFSMTIKRAFIPLDPLLCVEPEPMETPETLITTSFRIAGPGVNRQVTGTASWKCFLADPDNKLRVHGGGGSGGTGGGEPSASIRTEVLTSNPGPDDVELDASQSEDAAPGTIVAYQFWVADRDSGAVVAGPIVGAAPAVVVTLPPGDYLANVTVTDNDGLSDTASRGLSVK
jgi:uncharacterized repeat protein (TIGR01451 family)